MTAALLPVLLLFAPPPPASAGACAEEARVVVMTELGERWDGPVRSACTSLATMADADPSATIRMTVVGRDLVVDVTLGDGRTTLRRVRDPSLLGPTLEALVAVPALPEPRPVAVAPPPRVDPPRAIVIERSPSLVPAIELGAGVGGRLSGSQGYRSATLDGFALLRLGDVLVGVTARWDAWQDRPGSNAPGFEMSTVGGGILVARRFAIGPARLDLGVSPRFVVEMQSHGTATSEVADSQSDVRLGTTARAFAGHGAWRPFVSVDGEVSPGRFGRRLRIDAELPTLPAWSIGVDIGAAWGQP